MHTELIMKMKTITLKLLLIVTLACFVASENFDRWRHIAPMRLIVRFMDWCSWRSIALPGSHCDARRSIALLCLRFLMHVACDGYGFRLAAPVDLAKHIGILLRLISILIEGEYLPLSSRHRGWIQKLLRLFRAFIRFLELIG
jgi:hypothetical protein